MKTNGMYVIENRAGQVVRTLDWRTEKLSVIYREDTGRVDTVSDIKDLDADETPYTHLLDVTRSDVEKKPVKIKNLGTLRFVQDFEVSSPSPRTEDDDQTPFIVSLKWIGGVATGMLAILLIAGHFIKPTVDEELRIIEVVERPQEKKPEVKPEPMRPQKIKKMVVAAVTHKMKTPRQATVKTLRRSSTPVRTNVALNQIGALGVLGSLSNSKQKGGLNLGAVHTSPGVGMGGSEGSGGMQTSIYGKGLVSAPLGSGQRANGGGGYGTRGKGGGQAGYGQISLVGSSGAYFQPVESDAIVEGGLDRNAIAAVIQRHSGEIRYCYEQGLQTKPNLSGRVAVRFFIGGDGYVTSALVGNSSLHAAQVEGCITSRLKSWKFPNPKGGVTVKVTYPFVLRRVSDG